MVIRTTDARNTARLASRLLEWDKVKAFQLSPTGD
jgi:hypothetical protein